MHHSYTSPCVGRTIFPCEKCNMCDIAWGLCTSKVFDCQFIYIQYCAVSKCTQHIRYISTQGSLYQTVRQSRQDIVTSWGQSHTHKPQQTDTLLESDLLCCLDHSLHPHKLWHTLFRIWAMSNSTQYSTSCCGYTPIKSSETLFLSFSLNLKSKLILKSVLIFRLGKWDFFTCQH